MKKSFSFMVFFLAAKITQAGVYSPQTKMRCQASNGSGFVFTVVNNAPPLTSYYQDAVFSGLSPGGSKSGLQLTGFSSGPLLTQHVYSVKEGGQLTLVGSKWLRSRQLQPELIRSVHPCKIHIDPWSNQCLLVHQSSVIPFFGLDSECSARSL